MKTALVFLFLVAATLGAARPTFAGVHPYVRAAFSGNDLRVDNIDANIAADEQAFRNATGYPVELERVGRAVGPDLAAGIWLAPWVRIGAMYSSHRETVLNDIGINHQTTGYHYVDEMEFRTEEMGGEIVLRAKRLAGLCLGGQAARTRARFSQNFSESDFWSEYHLRGTGERTRVTYAAFVGLDQTNEHGIAGFMRAGYRFRDFGSMPARVTEWDASTSDTYETSTIPLDYSGFFMSLGIGFDLGW